MQSLQYSRESSDIDESLFGTQNSRTSSNCSKPKGCSFGSSSNSTISSCKQAIRKKCPDALEKVFETDAELFTECIDYLRSSVLIPLSWAAAKALRYRPSDPKHYIACQLLRWHYGNVSTREQNRVKEFVITTTLKMDEKFIQQQCQVAENVLSECDEEPEKDILCQFCWQNRVHGDYCDFGDANSSTDPKTNSSITPACSHVHSQESSLQ